MPPPQRRAGSRRADISEPLRAALAAEVAGLETIDDPVARIRAVNDFYAEIDYELEQFAALRLADMRTLKARGWSYDRIAEVTGLSKARVAQLLRRAQGDGDAD